MSRNEIINLFENKEYNKIFETYIPTIINVCTATGIINDEDKVQEIFMYAWEYITNYTDYNSDVLFSKRLYCAIYRHIRYIESRKDDKYDELFDTISSKDFDDGGINQILLRESFKTIKFKILENSSYYSKIGVISNKSLYIILEHILEGRSLRDLSKEFNVSQTQISIWYRRGLKELRCIFKNIR